VSEGRAMAVLRRWAESDDAPVQLGDPRTLFAPDYKAEVCLQNRRDGRTAIRPLQALVIAIGKQIYLASMEASRTKGSLQLYIRIAQTPFKPNFAAPNYASKFDSFLHPNQALESGGGTIFFWTKGREFGGSICILGLDRKTWGLAYRVAGLSPGGEKNNIVKLETGHC